MVKFYTLLLSVFIFAVSSSAQTFQLFTEGFEGPTYGFTLNTTGPGSSPLGSNKWIINNSYTGGFGYPNTTPEDSTVSGTIGGAPFSNYLHIYDEEGAPAITDASYDPSDPSDNFTVMTTGFCTLGLTDIEFTFFYLCEGSPTAYGQVYYSLDGGAWTPCGMGLYNSQHLWKYEVITDPLFENHQDVRFGFRWVNDDAGGSSTLSFSIDDIIAVGTYDAALTPVALNIDFLFPDPVCRLSTLIFGWSLSQPLCDGTYDIQLSNSSGSFASPTDLGVFSIGPLDTTGALAVIIPGTTPVGTCYKIRIIRVSPLPNIIGEASVCFEVVDCPNTITTLPPVVTYDTNAVCVHSVIDVPFFSTGVFTAGNVYTAQLSDSTGSFASPYTLGTFVSTATFDPALGSPPGTVSGLVPDVPPGCNYYIRVVSSVPSVIGSVYGPICIQDCDIETNNIEDIYVCITEDSGVTIIVPYDTHVFDSIEAYCPDNEFLIEILDPMFFSEVSLGDLGLTVDTDDGTITMTIPGYFDLLALGLDAGVWYMRIISSCADPEENTLGTLIHLTIGAPADDPPVLIPADTLLCEGSIGSATVVPYNPNSDYQFQFGTGTPFVWPYNPIFINFSGSSGDVTLRVREINYGCPGPWSDYITFHVIDVPIVTITGPIKACTGDTVYYSVPFFLTTYYDWSLTGGSIVDTANNVVGIVWDTIGTYTLSVFALNECGSGTGHKTITVVQTTNVDAGPDATICNGASVMLNAGTDGVVGYGWFVDSVAVGGDFVLTVAPDSTTQYVMIAEDEEGCPSYDTVNIYVEYPETESDSLSFCVGTNAQLDAGHPGSAYSWSNGATSQVTSVNQPGEYTVQINDPVKACDITKTFEVTEIIADCDPIINIPNAFSPNGDGVNDNLMIFGAAITEFHISIFNRWGEVVYQSDDPGILNDPAMGWDGKYKGQTQVMGTYVYVVSATGGSGKTITLQGNVTLIR